MKKRTRLRKLAIGTDTLPLFAELHTLYSVRMGRWISQRDALERIIKGVHAAEEQALKQLAEIKPNIPPRGPKKIKLISGDGIIP